MGKYPKANNLQELQIALANVQPNTNTLDKNVDKQSIDFMQDTDTLKFICKSNSGKKYIFTKLKEVE